MALESGDPRAFVLAALQGRSKGKKRSDDAPPKSALKKVDNKPLNKRQRLAAKKAKAATVIEEPEAQAGVKRLRQDALQWKLLSAQPEDFGDDFGDDIEAASEEDDQEVKKSSRKAKADPMANLFDNEGGMMMLEEVDGVDVVWEEDGKGGKKAILVVSDCGQDVVVLLVIRSRKIGSQGKALKTKTGASTAKRKIRSRRCCRRRKAQEQEAQAIRTREQGCTGKGRCRSCDNRGSYRCYARDRKYNGTAGGRFGKGRRTIGCGGRGGRGRGQRA